MTLNARAPVSVFEEFLSVPSTIVQEGKIRFDSDGLSMRVVDPANVAMVDVAVGASQFERYDSTDGVIGISLERLEEVIGMADSGEIVEIELNEETRKLDVEIGSQLSFTVALIDPDSVRQEPDIPDGLDLPATLSVPGSELNRGLQAADLVSDRVTLSADPDEKAFHIAADGDTDDVDVTLNGDTLTDVSVSKSCESLFSLNYLQDMKRGIPGDESVEFDLGTEMPVMLDFETDSTDVLCMLAPRIES
jgi:proliferating cell nuclear antigen